MNGARALRPLAAAALLLAAGCSSTNYSRARETRFDRPYRGGAASVPEGDASPRRVDPRSSAEGAYTMFAFLGAIATMAFHGQFHSGPLPQDYPLESTPRR